MKMTMVSFRLTEDEAKFLEMSVKKANMSKTEYIHHCIRNNEIRVVDKSKEIYQGLCDVQKVISIQEKMNPSQDYGTIREAVFAVCQLIKP